jgi:hypothetical protein
MLLDAFGCTPVIHLYSGCCHFILDRCTVRHAVAFVQTSSRLTILSQVTAETRYVLPWTFILLLLCLSCGVYVRIGVLCSYKTKGP